MKGFLNMRHIAMGAGVIELGFLRTLGVGFLPEMAHRFLEEQKERTIQFQISHRHYCFFARRS